MHLHTPLKYKAWADQRTLDAVARIDRETHVAQFDFARQQLNHMVRVEELFRARLTGGAEPHDSTNTPELPPFETLAARLGASNQWLQDYAQALQPDHLEQRIHFTFVDGKKGALSREEVLYHLINHGTYHRGAIGHALDLAKAPRPADTFTVFIHATEPDRRED
ncbi:MAG: DinB family protein [Proteobacteria bacterium]|nr:DinB family protein [Pseudomonadota bacterium]